MIQAALIIPALNEEPVLARTLRAIPPGLFQMVIVADNGSTDGTAAVAPRGRSDGGERARTRLRRGAA